MDDAPRPGIGVRLAADGTVARVTVDNRTKLNTLDRALMRAFVAEIEALGKRGDLRAVVLSGFGDKAFIGGANIPEMAALDRGSAGDFIALVHRTCDCLRQLPVPVIARIDGYALGAPASRWRCPVICGSRRRGRNSACRRSRSAFRRWSRRR